MSLLRHVGHFPVLRSSAIRRFSTDSVAHPSHKVQIYRLTSQNPHLNLSIEHHLLQNSSAGSTILLLYTNSPSVIFGRNQNPWLEVNLARLAQTRDSPEAAGWTDEAIQLVRRRSGGGTVFHDNGNVNFSVICPPDQFDRNKHAEMVVRALRRLGRPNTRVNERHDIVMDVPPDAKGVSTFKISGSAYKLTRLRSLHHGTCLLRSPNLANISGLLRSPAEPFIKARGVDSVRSPVRNVDVDMDAFEDAAREEFKTMYGDTDVDEQVGEEALAIPSLRKGYDELRSRGWIYGQTPRFTFSTHATEGDPRERPALPFDFAVDFEARHGSIERFDTGAAHAQPTAGPPSSLIGGSIQDIPDWTVSMLAGGRSEEEARVAGSWLNEVLGTAFTKRR